MSSRSKKKYLYQQRQAEIRERKIKDAIKGITAKLVNRMNEQSMWEKVFPAVPITPPAESEKTDEP